MQKAYYQFQHLIDKRMPLSSIVRWFIIAGILLRYYIGLNEYSVSTRLAFFVSLIVFSIYAAIIIVVDYYQYRHPEYSINKAWYLLQIIIDTAVFTLFYILTGC